MAQNKSWSGHVSLGLVLAPIELYVAGRAERVEMHQIHGVCGHRIKQQLFCPVDDRTVDRSEIVKGYEYEKDHYVTVDDDELKAIKPKSDKTLALERFVDASAVDPMLYETSYYMIPDPKIEGAKKAYALILAALKAKNKVGIGSVILSGSREHTVIVRPYKQPDGQELLAVHTMFYKSEVRSAPAFDAGGFSEKELELAGMLIDGQSAPFDHNAYTDRYQQNVHQLIEAKREGKVVPIRQPEKTEAIGDLADALARSLAAMKEGKGGKPDAAPKAAGKKQTQAA